MPPKHYSFDPRRRRQAEGRPGGLPVVRPTVFLSVDVEARRRGLVAPAEFAQGVIVARVELHNVVPIDDAAIDADQHAYATGPYLWLFRDVVPVKPIKLRGRQGLFDAGDLRVRAL
jgi:hypothetical protein